jgi:hypothetical protein
MSGPVKQHVQLAELLLHQYGEVVERMLRAWWNANDDKGSLIQSDDVHVLGAEAQRLYAGVWEQLEDAAAAARAAGRAVEAYAQLRAQPELDRVTAIRGVTFAHATVEKRGRTYDRTQLTLDQNDAGLAAARAAIRGFQAAFGEVDWTPHVEPEVDLRPRGLLSRLFNRKK